MTPMIGALLCGFTDIVRLLISAGANVNAVAT
jgi:ankyrin repeat protein